MLIRPISLRQALDYLILNMKQKMFYTTHPHLLPHLLFQVVRRLILPPFQPVSHPSQAHQSLITVTILRENNRQLFQNILVPIIAKDRHLQRGC